MITRSIPILSVAAASMAAAQPGIYEDGRALSAQLLAGDIEALGPQLSPAFLEAIGGEDGLEKLTAQLSAEAGAETKVLREAAYQEAGHVSYYRVSRFEKMPSVTMRWVFGPDGRVAAASVGPTVEPAPTDRLGYQTQATLRLPFGAPAQGRWYVAWGGRDAISNYHVEAPDQRFAYDFLVARGRDLFAGEGARNEDHFCWDEPVYAPAAGTVVAALGDVPDNARPGVKAEGVPVPGNHVVIDHGAGEHSLVAHFRQGTLAVKPGDAVEAGTLLGRCGNSGNSTLPHVHYHLQTGAAFKEGLGLPAFFTDYFAGGEYVVRSEPVRGQLLVPAARD